MTASCQQKENKDLTCFLYTTSAPAATSSSSHPSHFPSRSCRYPCMTMRAPGLGTRHRWFAAGETLRALAKKACNVLAHSESPMPGLLDNCDAFGSTNSASLAPTRPVWRTPGRSTPPILPDLPHRRSRPPRTWAPACTSSNLSSGSAGRLAQVRQRSIASLGGSTRLLLGLYAEPKITAPTSMEAAPLKSRLRSQPEIRRLATSMDALKRLYGAQ